MEETLNYRKYYKNYYNIDLDHNNNNIDNLLLLPKSLHKEYHKLLEEIKPISDDGLILIIKSIVDSGSAYNSFSIQMMNRFLRVYNECQKWANYKAFLDGIIPNIHNIEVQNGSH